MVNRRRFMGQLQDSRFTELEYIEGTGMQYIDTGIIPGKITNRTVVITASCMDDNGCLFGCSNSDKATNLGRFGYTPGSLEKGANTCPEYGNQIGTDTNGYLVCNKVDLTNKTTIRLGVGGFYQNDIKICDVSGSPTNDYSIYLLGYNEAGASSRYRFSAKLYSFQVYAYSYPNGQLLMDLVPVFDNKLRKPCLYDRLDHKLYYNAGTGEFLYKPKNPVELEYLESNGLQCIDSGVCLDTSSDIKTVVELEIPLFNKYGPMLFGGAMSTSNNLYTCHISQEDNKYYLNFKYGQTNDDYIVRQEINLNQKYTVTISRNYFSVDDIQYENPNSANKFEANKTNINLFCINLFCTSANHWIGSSVRIYSAKIYKDDVLIRDFIPILDTDGVLCLYDKIESKYYYNTFVSEVSWITAKPFAKWKYKN